MARTPSTITKDDDKKPPARTSPGRFIKQASPSAIAKSPNESHSSNRNNKAVVTKLQSGDMLMMLQGYSPTAMPPFFLPTRKYFNANPEYVQKKLGIWYHTEKVHPQNHLATEEKEAENSTNPRGTPVLICNVDGNKLHLNNPPTRKKWVETYCQFHNHPSMSKLYHFFRPMEFGGDLTPTDQTHCPYLSDFCTFQDTMEVAQIANSAASKDGGKLSITEVIMEPELMKMYFSPQHLPDAEKYFERYHTNPNEPSNPWEDAEPNPPTEDDFSDLPNFSI